MSATRWTSRPCPPLSSSASRPGGDGAIVHDSRWRAWNGPVFDAVRDRAHAAGTKVVVSVSRFSWSPDETTVTIALLGSSPHQVRLAAEIAAEVVRRGVDGVDVDLEPVPAGQAGAYRRSCGAFAARSTLPAPACS